MNTSLSTRSPGPRTGTGSGAGYGRRTERGIAVLVILTLLACMAILMAANSEALAFLKQELNLIDQQQRLKYGQGQRD